MDRQVDRWQVQRYRQTDKTEIQVGHVNREKRVELKPVGQLGVLWLAVHDAHINSQVTGCWGVAITCEVSPSW